jgi:hypothetical protein
MELYLNAVDPEAEFGDREWEAIHKEMLAVVTAPSDRRAANIIRWWGCWDRKFSATACARKIRQVWAERQGPK